MNEIKLLVNVARTRICARQLELLYDAND